MEFQWKRFSCRHSTPTILREFRLASVYRRQAFSRYSAIRGICGNARFRHLHFWYLASSNLLSRKMLLKYSSDLLCSNLQAVYDFRTEQNTWAIKDPLLISRCSTWFFTPNVIIKPVLALGLGRRLHTYGYEKRESVFFRLFFVHKAAFLFIMRENFHNLVKGVKQ